MTVDENDVDDEQEYLAFANDWSVHSDDSREYKENKDPVQIGGFEVSLENQDYELIDGPMDSAWPMQGHDVYHTCQSPYSTINNTGVEKWFIKTIWDDIEGSAVIDNDGVIYFGSMGADRYLYALYPNGTQKWKYLADGSIWCTPAIADDGTLYFTTSGAYHYFYALTPNGTEKWLFAPDDSCTSSPTIGGDNTIYFGSNDKFIYAINPNGTLKWRYLTGDIVMGSPAIDDDGTIYMGSMDRYFYALYSNGTLRWRFNTGAYIKGEASIADDGTIYVPAFNGYFYALYPNGTLKWKASTGDSIAAAGVAIAEDGTLYVGTEQLRAYYPNGTLKWVTNVHGSIYGTIPALSADGTIYVSAGLDLVAVNPNGTERWRRTIADTHAYSSPSIGADGTVYVGSTWGGTMDYGYFYAFGSLDPNAPSTPTITGQTNGKIERTYDYTFTSTSPLGSQIYYLISWGDGTTTDWLGPYNSGEPLTMNHSWSEKGTYNITARAKDTDNRWGPWGELQVSMPKTKDLFITHPLLNWFWERFPNAFPILRYLFEK
jgi:outer membrane protein assembly factor BamB